MSGEIILDDMNKQRPLIAVIVSEADRSFICKALNCIQKELFNADMDAVVFSTILARAEEITVENKLFDVINYENIDGFIVFLKGLSGSDVQKKIGAAVAATGKPAVYMDEFVKTDNNTVYDYKEMAMTAAAHLAQVHGVRTAAYIDCHDHSVYYDCLRKNICEAADKCGINIPEDMKHFACDSDESLEKAVNELIAGGLPQAVLCCTDYSAAAVIGEFARKNIKVPDDIIVMGCCSGEPYRTSVMNISSVKRNPAKIAVSAARKIISAIKGTEYCSYEGSSGSFKKGFSCGCESLDLSSLSESVKNEMMPYGLDDFDSFYNYMQEELISAPDFTDFLWKLDWYTLYIKELKGLWLCLNDNIMHTAADFSDYTEEIDMPYFRINGQGDVNEDRKFHRSEMLPFIFEKRDKPAAFIFTPLHFENVNFGYIVLSFGDSGAVYDRIYSKWLRYVSCALEKQRRHTIYCDDTQKAQIRDPLTGLLNMRGFKRMMTEEFARSKGQLLRIISADVDNISGINKAYGYKEGDKVLQKIGVILNNCAGDGDICVRVSGDEFIIAGILDRNDPADEVPLKLERNLESYNGSCVNEYGIHIYTSKVTAEFDSLELLDTLPYDAAYRRNMTKDNQNKKKLLQTHTENEETFDPEERKCVVKMLNDNLFKYQFQPIVDAHTGEIFAYEALMRSGGEIKLSPVAILNHAAALNRLTDVEHLTLINTFDYLYTHPDEFENKMLFVNSIPSCTLSDRDFDDLYAKYRSIMDKIVIEFTEQTEASAEQLRSIVERSHRMNFKIAIDDYGTGYSNISNLLTFMPHCVKIDRSLIMNIQSDKRKQHFTRNIIEYAHDNNFKVLAEGVETPEELTAVIGMGIDLIQGYYTAKPSYEVIREIEPDIKEEIVQIYNRSGNAAYKKTYFTDDEAGIDLKTLDLGGYTDIFISSSEYVLEGSSDYTSELSVIIKDGIRCGLKLDNVNLRNERGEPCIKLGRGAKLTLDISGEVSIYGSVLVPETADLKIIGDGSLSVIQKSDRKFAIGNDLTHSYGNIGIYLDNKLDIKAGAEQCVAIGGGKNTSGSTIDIRVKELSLDISGKQVLGIGSFYADSNVRIDDSSVTMHLQCAAGIAVGGYGRGINVCITDSKLNVRAEGKNISGIYSAYANNGSINIIRCDVTMKCNGELIHGVGFENGFGSITSEDSSCDIQMEGGSCFALGSCDRNAKVILNRCGGNIVLFSENPHMLSANKENISVKDCNFSRYSST